MKITLGNIAAATRLTSTPHYDNLYLNISQHSVDFFPPHFGTPSPPQKKNRRERNEREVRMYDGKGLFFCFKQ